MLNGSRHVKSWYWYGLHLAIFSYPPRIDSCLGRPSTVSQVDTCRQEDAGGIYLMEFIQDLKISTPDVSTITEI